MLKVNLINKEEAKDFFRTWGEFSAKCYNTPIEKAEQVGKHCYNMQHFSGSRSFYFKFEIEGISRSCSLQLNRSEIGVVKNQQSQRYVDMKETDFVIPFRIESNPKAKRLFTELAETSKKTYLDIQQILLEEGFNKEQSNEDARYVLLEACETCGVWGFTIEALINFMETRLCTRSQNEIRQLAKAMRVEILEVLPEFEKYLNPKCVNVGYCVEGKSCGLRPHKENIMIIDMEKKMIVIGEDGKQYIKID